MRVRAGGLARLPPLLLPGPPAASARLRSGFFREPQRGGHGGPLRKAVGGQAGELHKELEDALSRKDNSLLLVHDQRDIFKQDDDEAIEREDFLSV